MSNSPVISDIKFHPVKPNKGHVGFVSILYDGRIWLKDIAVYRLLHPKEGRQYRLVYPQNKATNRNTYHPINEDTSKMIEREVNYYLAIQLQRGGEPCGF